MTHQNASSLVDPTTSKIYFNSLLETLSQRAMHTAMTVFRPQNAAVRAYLKDRLSAPGGTPGYFIADPVFEATFPWTNAPSTMDELVGEGLLSRALVDAMDRPDAHA